LKGKLVVIIVLLDLAAAWDNVDEVRTAVRLLKPSPVSKRITVII
jgi:hypothetical protein